MTACQLAQSLICPEVNNIVLFINLSFDCPSYEIISKHLTSCFSPLDDSIVLYITSLEGAKPCGILQFPFPNGQLR